MNDIAQALSPNDLVLSAWLVLVWGSAAYLLVLGVLIFLRPNLVRAFFGGFVASYRVNLLEASLRLIVGLAFVAVSPQTKLPLLFFGFGAVLAMTGVAMMSLYELHKRHAAWAVPIANRILPLMGVCAVGLGALIVWATS